MNGVGFGLERIATRLLLHRPGCVLQPKMFLDLDVGKLYLLLISCLG
jgi:hypothetical protein